MQTVYPYLWAVGLARAKWECLSVLGPLASMADVNAAGIELPNGVTVAISSPRFFNVQYTCEDTILLFLFFIFFPWVLGFIDRSRSILPDYYAIFKT